MKKARKYLSRTVLTVLLALLVACGGQRYHTVKVVKPNNKKRPYNPKKDKYKKRTKVVRMKSN